MQTLERQIFRAGSTTYYWSARFFPQAVREDVCKLYSFVRVADDYVDVVPQQTKAFYALRASWETAQADATFDTTPSPKDTIDQRVIKNIVALTRKYAFEPSWIASFLDAMQSDLEGKTYATPNDVMRYTYGSAEVVGLLMSRILGLPAAADCFAKIQGRAFQWINFIRDVAEDTALGRTYFPAAALKKFGLSSVDAAEADAHPEQFAAFMRSQISQYRSWQREAEQYYQYMPRRLRIPLQVAADMYKWSASIIEANPRIVFERKVKPPIFRVVARGLAATLRTHPR
ncbi:MAG TPA: phytoene/squalene synthase family protein [Bacillota bacterium]|nr:phytoene/squalene synthase family protein [Bacillota bacterium]